MLSLVSKPNRKYLSGSLFVDLKFFTCPSYKATGCPVMDIAFIIMAASICPLAAESEVTSIIAEVSSISYTRFSRK
jgi:hypothetical protein